VEYGRVLRSRTTKPADLDDPAVWAVTCFYIRRGHRGHGVASALLDAAIPFAKQHGAGVLEGYPVDPLGGRRQNAELYQHPHHVRAGGFMEVERRIHPADHAAGPTRCQ
jgi:GNAT superfamily N-acetyltransferase